MVNFELIHVVNANGVHQWGAHWLNEGSALTTICHLHNDIFKLHDKGCFLQLTQKLAS